MLIYGWRGARQDRAENRDLLALAADPGDAKALPRIDKVLLDPFL